MLWLSIMISGSVVWDHRKEEPCSFVITWSGQEKCNHVARKHHLEGTASRKSITMRKIITFTPSQFLAQYTVICNLGVIQQYQQLLHPRVSCLGPQTYSASARVRCWGWKANWIFEICGCLLCQTISDVLLVAVFQLCFPAPLSEHLLVPQLDFTDFKFLDYMTLQMPIWYDFEAVKCDLDKQSYPPCIPLVNKSLTYGFSEHSFKS